MIKQVPGVGLRFRIQVDSILDHSTFVSIDYADVDWSIDQMINILDKELGPDNYVALSRWTRGFQISSNCHSYCNCGFHHNIAILESEQETLLDHFYDHTNKSTFNSTSVIIVFKNIVDKVLYDLTDGYGYFTNEHKRSNVFETN